MEKQPEWLTKVILLVKVKVHLASSLVTPHFLHPSKLLPRLFHLCDDDF
jgi:hypothetical protein